MQLYCRTPATYHKISLPFHWTGSESLGCSDLQVIHGYLAKDLVPGTLIGSPLENLSWLGEANDILAVNRRIPHNDELLKMRALKAAVAIAELGSHRRTTWATPLKKWLNHISEGYIPYVPMAFFAMSLVGPTQIR